MERKKLFKQIVILLTIILLFILFDISFYNIITKKYINNYGDNVKEKSIDLEHYMPFKEDSEIVHFKSSLKIEENIKENRIKEYENEEDKNKDNHFNLNVMNEKNIKKNEDEENNNLI